MPVIKKLVKIGDARGVILPSEWLKAEEEKLGNTIEYVILDIINHSIHIHLAGEINKEIEGSNGTESLGSDSKR